VVAAHLGEGKAGELAADLAPYARRLPPAGVARLLAHVAVDVELYQGEGHPALVDALRAFRASLSTPEPTPASPSAADPLGDAAAELRALLAAHFPDDPEVMDMMLDVARRRPLAQGLRLLLRCAADVAEHEGADRPALRTALDAFRQKLAGSLPGLTLSTADAADLREQIEDLAAAGDDATRPLAHRRLGRPLARAAIRAAYRKASTILAQAGEGASHG
jgi:hypothetical protein